MKRIETFKEFAKYLLDNNLECYGRSENRCYVRNIKTKLDKIVIEVGFNYLLENTWKQI